ncbi:NEDD4 family-interacting protein 1-like [Hydractinia symbiolongicarpus]|uniref:NEDD4 family-interacting protein 1-like n=1 Tax=Hydractinia symbiolongicarpus TaxID=13093 RepID=UPI00254A705D|nr:NEDD4 family-interacting protein 1-like [Hydractinia symbiolongicarpus]
MTTSNPKYQLLQNEDDDQSTPNTEIVNDSRETELSEQVPPPPVVPAEDNTPLTASNTESPPPYDGATEEATTSAVISNEPPPLYTDIVKLPTYNESENIETENEEENPQNASMFLFWLSNASTVSSGFNDEQLGTDVGFIFSFLVAFIFNWIGFLVAYCFTTSLSSNYGAISGFGLSLVKWAFIVKHSEWSKNYFEENPWLMYVFVLFGWIVFLRGIFAYAQLKRYVYSRRQENADSENGMFT